MWDVDIEKDNNLIIIGGWDCVVYALDLQGNEVWNYKTDGYVRSVKPLEDGGVLAGSHDHKIYRLNDKGELKKIYDVDGEITCVCTSLSTDLVYAGAGNNIFGFDSDDGNYTTTENSVVNNSVPSVENEDTVSEDSDDYEPMFGFGMFDEPSPDTTEILERDDYSVSETSSETKDYSNNYASTYQSSRPSYQDSTENIDRGGEYREFAAKVLKGDVKNYLRLGNAAWLEKRLERAAEHFRKATEIDPDEPRAWHNLAVCNYHLSLKGNPDDVEGAVASAYEPLKIAKEKGGSEYTSVDKTLAFLASQIGIEE